MINFRDPSILILEDGGVVGVSYLFRFILTNSLGIAWLVWICLYQVTICGGLLAVAGLGFGKCNRTVLGDVYFEFRMRNRLSVLVELFPVPPDHFPFRVI